MPENFVSEIGFVTNGTICRGGLSMWKVLIILWEISNLYHYLRDKRGFKYVMLTLSSLEPFAFSGVLLANGSR